MALFVSGNPAHTSTTHTCSNCYKALPKDPRWKPCQECCNVIRTRFEALTKTPNEPHKRQPQSIAACSSCSALVKLPPHPIDPNQALLCVQCHQASLVRLHHNQQERKRTQQSVSRLQPPKTARDRGDDQIHIPPNLSGAALARLIADTAVQYVHTADENLQLGNSGAKAPRVRPPGLIEVPASQIPPVLQSIEDPRHYNERGEILVPRLVFNTTVSPPPLAMPTPTAYTYITKSQAHTQIRSAPRRYAQTSSAASLAHAGPSSNPAVAPPASMVAMAPPAFPPQLIASSAVPAPTPGTRHPVPATAMIPPHLKRPSGGRPITLQHFHASSVPQRSYDGACGLTEPDAQIAGNVRVCEMYGCSKILSPKHLWRVCSRCLANVDPAHAASLETGPAVTQEEKSTPRLASGGTTEDEKRSGLTLTANTNPPARSSADTLHVHPMSAASYTRPNVQPDPPPIARSWRSASLQPDSLADTVDFSSQGQTAITIPSLFTQPRPGAQKVHTKHRRVLSSVSAAGSGHSHHAGEPQQQWHATQAVSTPNTASTLRHVDTVLREYTGIQSTTRSREPAEGTGMAKEARAQSAGSICAQALPVPVPNTQDSKPADDVAKPRRVTLPLPRGLKNADDASKPAGGDVVMFGQSADNPIVLDDVSPCFADVVQLSCLPEERDDPGKDVFSTTDNGLPATSISQVDTHRDASMCVDDAPRSPGIGQSKADISTPGDLSLTYRQTNAYAQKSAEGRLADVQISADPPAVGSGDTIDEDDVPLSSAVKGGKPGDPSGEDEAFLLKSLQLQGARPTCTTSSSPSSLRVRKPSFKKSNHTSDPAPMSTPSSPQAPTSTHTPNITTSGPETPGGSDISELTPLEDTSDEDFPEYDELEKPKLKIKLSIPESLRSPERQTRLQVPRTGQKTGSTCNIRKCQNLLAPGYRWKLCDICRERNRLLQRRLKAARDGGDIYGGRKKKAIDLSSHPPGSRECTSRWCRNVIPPGQEYRWKMCKSCRRELRKQEDNFAVLLKGPESLALGSLSGKRKRAQEEEHNLDSWELQYPDDGEDLPYVDKTPNAYQHLGVLLDTLQERFQGFLSAQMRYLHFKVAQGVDVATTSPTVFSFDGEYSIVADPTGGVVDQAVRTLVEQFEIALGLKFSPAGIFMGQDASVVSRFGCVREVRIPLPPPAQSEPPTPEGVVNFLLRRMAGEMEVSVAWDRRHKYFPGQRVSIRFRLIS